MNKKSIRITALKVSLIIIVFEAIAWSIVWSIDIEVNEMTEEMREHFLGDGFLDCVEKNTQVRERQPNEGDFKYAVKFADIKGKIYFFLYIAGKLACIYMASYLIVRFICSQFENKNLTKVGT